jgi:hypothetical protein
MDSRSNCPDFPNPSLLEQNTEAAAEQMKNINLTTNSFASQYPKELKKLTMNIDQFGKKIK